MAEPTAASRAREIREWWVRNPNWHPGELSQEDIMALLADERERIAAMGECEFRCRGCAGKECRVGGLDCNLVGDYVAAIRGQA